MSAGVAPADTRGHALVLEDVVADPDALREVVRTSGPHATQATYVPASLVAAFAAGHPLLGSGGGVAPVFRSDWYRWGARNVHGARLAGDARLVDAARRLFDAPEIVPTQVHVNLTVPGDQPDTGHVDVPVLHGLDRRTAPGWLLLALVRSGVATPWTLRTATAVAWFHRGRGGEFTWWPDGPDQPAVSVSSLWNRAIVMDADRTLHRVEPLGGVTTRDLFIERDTLLDASAEGRGWLLLHPGRASTRLTDPDVRISISWKAAVFATARERIRYERGDDALDLDTAVRLLADEVRRRGGDTHVRDRAGLAEPAFVALVERLVPRPVPNTTPPGGPRDR